MEIAANEIAKMLRIHFLRVTHQISQHPLRRGCQAVILLAAEFDELHQAP